MGRHDNDNEAELQRDIAAQEQALTALLDRVMNSPLASLRAALDELRGRLDAVEQAHETTVRSTEAYLEGVVEEKAGGISRKIGDVTAEIDSLKGELAGLARTLSQHHASLAERDERVDRGLARTHDLLGVLDAKVDAADAALAGVARAVVALDGALGALCEHGRASADQLNAALGGIGQQLEDQEADLHSGLEKTGALLAQLDSKADATGERLAAATRGVGKLDTELGALRQQEQMGTGQLNKELSGLAQQLEKQQTRLAERIEAVRPALAPRLDALAAAIGDASRDAAQAYANLPESQRAVVSAVVQQELALQLHPLQKRATWLIALCGLSVASSLTLVGMLLFR